MSKKVSFAVDKRDHTGGRHARRLRKNERKVPGVVYGNKENPVSVQVDLVPLEKLYYTAGEGTIINLDIQGDEKVDVLIQSADFHPVTNEITHIDFMRIDPNKKVHATIPLRFVGESPAVKVGGVLVRNREEIEIECLPKNLVHHIDIDISVLTEMGNHLSVSDIKLPEGVVINVDAQVIIAHVEAPRAMTATSGEGETTETEETTEDNSEQAE